MQDILLIAAVAAVFAFGWYLMGKLDAFLESNRQDQIALLSASENILRIGFFDPLVADSLSGVLEKYSKIHPSVSASLFSGTETELMREFSLHKLDMIFLPENASVPEKIRGQVDEVSLEHMPVVMQYCGGCSGAVSRALNRSASHSLSLPICARISRIRRFAFWIFRLSSPFSVTMPFFSIWQAATPM